MDIKRSFGMTDGFKDSPQRKLHWSASEPLAQKYDDGTGIWRQQVDVRLASAVYWNWFVAVPDPMARASYNASNRHSWLYKALFG
jgi:hypothetical protein